MDIKSLLLSFNGRIGRGPFWAVIGVIIVIELILSGITSALSNGNGGVLALVFALVAFVVAAACVWVWLAVSVPMIWGVLKAWDEVQAMF